MAAHLTAHYGLAERTLDFESIPSVSFDGGKGGGEILMRSLCWGVTREIFSLL